MKRLLKLHNLNSDTVMIYVKDHKKFRCFNYVSEDSTGLQLGTVVKYINGNAPDIGVVIQTFSDGDFRTDMNGMTSRSEVVPATIEDVEKYRSNILSSIKK